MKPEWRRFAPFGLYLAILAGLVSFGLYFVQRQFNLALQISLSLIIVGLAVWVILDPQKVRQFLTGRQARHGSNALLLGIAFVGIVVMINYLVYTNNQRWDLTEDKQYTLAPETLNTLNSLPESVMAQAFYSSRTSVDRPKELLEQFKLNSKGKFDYEVIDPDADPVRATNAKITQDGTIVLVMGDRQQPVRFASEQEVVSGLVRLMNPEARVVYFLTGHGEYSPDDTGQQSYSAVKRTLESKNYSVKMLNLLATNQIPDDANVILIAGPRERVTQAEVDLLRQYQEKGSGLVVMEEPLPLTSSLDAPDPLADYLAERWKTVLGKDIVIDLTSNPQSAPFAAQYGRHAITQSILRTTSQFPTARSVSLATDADPNISLVPLVLTAPQSWAETDLKGITEGQSQVQFDEGQDTPGPVQLAVAAEDQANKTRAVVFGDSDFAIDGNFGAFANGDLLVNAVDWAAGEENLISLTPKNSTSRMMLPPQSTMLNLVFLVTVCILPALAIVGGIVVFIQRRRRG